MHCIPNLPLLNFLHKLSPILLFLLQEQLYTGFGHTGINTEKESERKWKYYCLDKKTVIQSSMLTRSLSGQRENKTSVPTTDNNYVK